MNKRLLCALYILVMVLCLWVPSPAKAENVPLMAHAAWLRLDALAADFPFAWARRYFELKSIAEDADANSLTLPSLLQRLHEVTVVAQRDVVTLLLDLVPAQANIQESSYIIGLLDNWSWKLEPALRRTASTAAGLAQALTVLEGIGQAVEEMQANPHKRPIMEKASQDFYELYNFVHKRVQQLNTDMDAVRSTTLEIYSQIEKTKAVAEKQMPAKWFAYYSTPLVVSYNAFSRFGVDFRVMLQNLLYDESYPSSALFAVVFNCIVLLGLLLVYTFVFRVASSAFVVGGRGMPSTFAQSLCVVLHSLDVRHKLAFGFCFIVMLNSVVDALPLFHEGIPFLFVQHIGMTVALTIWARIEPGDPALWELALPIVTGLLLLHGGAGALLLLLGLGGAGVVVLVSLLIKFKQGHSALRVVWLMALLVVLLLAVMGFGRLAVPLLMLIVVVRAAAVMLGVVNNNLTLHSYTVQRACFLPIFSLFLFLMSISFLVSCSGFDMLRNYWYANAVPILGFYMTFGDVIMILFFLMSMYFVSNISKQVLENLGMNRILDTSAVPVLHVVVNCLLVSIFGFLGMSSLGVDVTSLAFIGGGVSIGVGFAAKTILSNFFCGLVIIFSKMVRAGDVVEINGVSGRVLSVNMRATLIETTANGILLVPNEVLLDSSLTNWSLNDLHVLENIAISVSTNTDMATALSAMEDAAVSVAGVLSDPPPRALFTGFGVESMDFELHVWVKDIRTKIITLSEVRKALRTTLEARGVVLSMLVTKRLDVSVREQSLQS